MSQTPTSYPISFAHAPNINHINKVTNCITTSKSHRAHSKYINPGCFGENPREDRVENDVNIYEASVQALMATFKVSTSMSGYRRMASCTAIALTSSPSSKSKYAPSTILKSDRCSTILREQFEHVELVILLNAYHVACRGYVEQFRQVG
jgi:hypothetical protein